jgi:hypothetical protein
MKNLRKLLAVVVVVAMMATFMIPAFAEESTLSNAEICETLGMLKGTGDGVTDEYLASATERNQAAIMFLRLQGLEDEALAYDGEDNFDDADELWSGGQAILAYLKANPDLGWQGVGDNKFEPRVNIDAKSYYKVMLEALGYKQDVDFEWGEVLEFAAEKGLSAIADVEELTNADIATATVEALKATVKDSELTLIEKLIADGIIDEDAAVDAGLVSGELAVKELKAISKNTLQVTLNKNVPDTATVTVTRDGLPVTISKTTWVDGKTVKLAVSYKLFDGKYVVKVKTADEEAISAEVEIKESAVANILFLSDSAVLSSDPADLDKIVKVSIRVENQYGDNITSEAEGSLKFSASKGDAVISDGRVTITATSAFVVDEKVTLTIVDPETGVVASKVLVVGSAMEIGSIAIGDPISDDEDAVMDQQTDLSTFKLPLTIIDQYGNEITDDGALADDITIISSNDAIIDGTACAFETSDDKAYLVLGDGTDAGVVTITLVSKSGKVGTKVLTVKEDAAIDTFTLMAPSAIVKQGIPITIPFTAIDQFGKQVTEATGSLAVNSCVGGTLELGPNDSKTVINVTNGTISTTTDIDNNLVIKVTPGDAASKKVTMVATPPSAKVKTLTLTVKDAPVATSIGGIKADPFYNAMQVGEIQALAATVNDIKVLDQYGDVMDSIGTYKLEISKVDSVNNKVTYGAGNFTADNAGTTQYKIYLKDDSDNTKDTYSFTMEAVALKDIGSFGIEDIDKIYTGTSERFNDAAEYDRTVKIYGKKGTKDVLVDPDLLKAVTSSTFTINGKVIEHASNNIDTDGADKTAKIFATIAGSTNVITVSKDVTYSSATPKAVKLIVRDKAKVEITDGVVYEAAANLASSKILGTDTDFVFYAEDQYGVAAKALTYVVSNIDNPNTDISIDGDGVLTVTGDAIVAGDSFVITVVIDGFVKNLKVIAE